MNGTSKVNIAVYIWMKTLTLITLTIILLGCSTTDVNRDIYNALIQRECIQKTGEPNCDSGQPSYDEYRREVDSMNK